MNFTCLIVLKCFFIIGTWTGEKMIMPLSSQHGEKKEDTWSNHLISAKLGAYHDLATSEPNI